MPRNDIALPPSYLDIATARSLGAPIRVMQGGSRLEAMRNKLMTIAVFEHGALVSSAGPQPVAFRYDEVDRFVQYVVRKYGNTGYRGSETMCWVGLRDGHTYSMGGRSTRTERHIIDDFRDLVDPRIAAAQLPRMQAALRQGQPLDFGDYVLEPGGLYMAGGFARREKRLAWADIREVKVQGGGVVVLAHGRRTSWAVVGVSRVPNLTAFLTLVRAATSGGAVF